jgi:hypothetical protein
MNFFSVINLLTFEEQSQNSGKVIFYNGNIMVT